MTRFNFLPPPARAAWPLLACLMLAGCSGPDYEVVPISGRVTLDGDPLEDVEVTFQPMAVKAANPNPGPGSYGLTDADGHYSLRTVEPAEDGAVVAKHVVYLSIKYASEGLGDEIVFSRETVLPRCCRDGTMKYEVLPGGTDHADFALTSD